MQNFQCTLRKIKGNSLRNFFVYLQIRLDACSSFLYLVHLNWEYSTILRVITPETFFWYLVIAKETISSPSFVKHVHCKFALLLLALNVFAFYEIKDFFDFAAVVWRDWNHWSQFNNAVLLPNTCTYYLQICRHSLWKLTLLYCFLQFLSITFFNQ